MDLSTVIGIFSGFFLIGLAIFMKPGAGFFFKPDAFLIVVGGIVSATLINFPLKDVLGSIKVAKNAFRQTIQPVHAIIERMVLLSKKARVEGLLSLEKDLAGMDDEFMKKGLQLMVDGTETDVLRNIMTTELMYLEDRHAMGQDIFKAMGTYAPAFGMAGTLIGLIQMLQQLQDPSKIGAGMAVAMVTTFYGVILANLIFIPIAGKLKQRSQEEVLGRELVVEAVCAIQAGDNPRLLRDKLVTFIAPSSRQAITDGSEAG